MNGDFMWWKSVRSIMAFLIALTFGMVLSTEYPPCSLKDIHEYQKSNREQDQTLNIYVKFYEQKCLFLEGLKLRDRPFLDLWLYLHPTDKAWWGGCE